MKKVLKIAIILMILMIGFGELTVVRAAPTTMTQQTDTGLGGSPSGSATLGVDNPDSWDPRTSPDGDATILNSKVRPILGVIRTVGVVVSVVVLMILGIKNMLASIEQKSVIKQAMPGYIIGAIMVAAMTALPAFIYDFVTK